MFGLLFFTACREAEEDGNAMSADTSVVSVSETESKFDIAEKTEKVPEFKKQLTSERKLKYEEILTEKALPDDVAVIYRIDRIWLAEDWSLLLCEAPNEKYGFAIYLASALDEYELYGYRKMDIEIPEDFIFDGIQLIGMDAAHSSGIMSIVLGFTNETKIQYYIFSTIAPCHPQFESTYTFTLDAPEIRAEDVLNYIEENGFMHCVSQNGS